MSREEFRACAGSPDYARSLAVNPPGGGSNPNLLSFINTGGLLGEGVCWWHSRFTRAALYLAYFEPDAPRACGRRLHSILSGLMDAGGIVAIPGYRNLREFSEDNRRSIQAIFDRRQLSDGILRFAWVNGLAGASKVRPAKLLSLMDSIHEATLEGLSYVKLQVRGIDAHSLVVTAMDPLPGGGYRCCYLDSNWPGERVWEYRPGSDSVSAVTGIPGVPYLQRVGELRKMKRMVARFLEGEDDRRPEVDG